MQEKIAQLLEEIMLLEKNHKYSIFTGGEWRMLVENTLREHGVSTTHLEPYGDEVVLSTLGMIAHLLKGMSMALEGHGGDVQALEEASKEPGMFEEFLPEEEKAANKEIRDMGYVLSRTKGLVDLISAMGKHLSFMVPPHQHVAPRPDGIEASLRQIKNLLDQGLIDQEDYDRKKREILDDM